MDEKSLRIRKNETLALKSARALRDYIVENFSNGGRLPSEPELAKLMGVNRGTVRQALSVLEQTGVIIRKHGSGTYVNTNVLGMKMRVDTHLEYIDLIKTAGYTPRMELVSVQSEPVSSEMSDILGLEENAILVCVRKLFLIDDKPTIFTEEWLPDSLIKKPVMKRTIILRYLTSWKVIVIARSRMAYQTSFL